MAADLVILSRQALFLTQAAMRRLRMRLFGGVAAVLCTTQLFMQLILKELLPIEEKSTCALLRRRRSRDISVLSLPSTAPSAKAPSRPCHRAREKHPTRCPQGEIPMDAQGHIGPKQAH